MARSATLPALLAGVLRTLERSYIEKLGGRSAPSLDLWANFLRVVDHTGVECSQLPATVRLSKRAVQSRLSAAVRQGWAVRVTAGPHHDCMRLTRRGAEAAALWKSAQHEAEADWRERMGAPLVDKLWAALESLVYQLPLEHPHYPAGYGAADARITGGGGRDWKPELRAPGPPRTPLPLSALVSQVLVAFAISYEEDAPVALGMSTEVLNRIPAEGCKLRELGRSAGLSALQRHGFVVVGAPEGDETVRLTRKGAEVNEAYDRRIQQVEERWMKQFGAGTVGELRRVLVGVSHTQAR